MKDDERIKKQSEMHHSNYNICIHVLHDVLLGDVRGVLMLNVIFLSQRRPCGLSHVGNKAHCNINGHD